MTQSYFKAIMWDNSNYVQEQRRSKHLVPLLGSSEPLAKTRLQGEEGEWEEGWGGGEWGGLGRGGERRGTEPPQGLPGGGGRSIAVRCLCCPGSPDSGWFLDSV